MRIDQKYYCRDAWLQHMKSITMISPRSLIIRPIITYPSSIIICRNQIYQLCQLISIMLIESHWYVQNDPFWIWNVRMFVLATLSAGHWRTSTGGIWVTSGGCWLLSWSLGRLVDTVPCGSLVPWSFGQKINSISCKAPEPAHDNGRPRGTWEHWHNHTVVDHDWWKIHIHKPTMLVNQQSYMSRQLIIINVHLPWSHGKCINHE